MLDNLTLDEEQPDLEALLDSVERDIRKASRSVAYQWPGVVEKDDVAQSIRLHLWERPNSLVKLAEMEAGPRYRSIVGIGHQIASAERTDYEHFTGDFRYSVNEVKSVLDSGVLLDLEAGLASSYSAEEYVSRGGGFEDATLAKASAETDLLRAMEELGNRTSQYAEAIRKRYLYDENAVAASDAERARLMRALTRLTDLMNRSYKRRHAARPDGPGTRSRVSRAAAQAITQMQDTGSFEGYNSPTRVQEGRI